MDDAAIAIPVGEDVVDRGAQRREAEAAGDNAQRPSLPPPRPASRFRMGRAGPTTAPASSFAMRSADRANIADGVDERAASSAGSPLMLIAHFADAECVEHVELPGLERRPRARDSGASSSVTVSVKLATSRGRPDKAPARMDREARAKLTSVLSHRRRGFAACVAWSRCHENGQKALHHRIAEMMIGIALPAQALCVHADGPRKLMARASNIQR